MKIGAVGRFFPVNWRSSKQEIETFARIGLQAIQFNGLEEGLTAKNLGNSYSEILNLLKTHEITPLSELHFKVNSKLITPSGLHPVQVLEKNLEYIKKLEIKHVNIHLYPADKTEDIDEILINVELKSQLTRMVSISQDNGFQLCIENNDPEQYYFATPERVKNIFDSVSNLKLFWDLNHTSHEYFVEFSKFMSSVPVIHISDTMLPETNFHLPLGLGNVDFDKYLGEIMKYDFSAGIFILEIGGLPKSGGYGRDTDEALKESLDFLKEKLKIS